jgi:CubicO group peptidase (beta-lactamase class C family)
MDSAPLLGLDRMFRGGEGGLVDGMLIIRNGHIVLQKLYEQDYVKINSEAEQAASLHSTTRPEYNYYDPEYHPYYRGTSLHTIQSITKPVSSLAIGIAIGRGEIPDVEARVFDYFADREISNLDDRKASMTIEDLITMRAGFEWNETELPYQDSRNHAVQLEKSDDWITFVLNHPMAHQPGTVHAYNSGASQLLSAIIKESTGETIDQYFEQHLFKPLGITRYHWKKSPENLPDTLGGLYLQPEDLAKIGYLLIKGGNWDGQQVLPEKWVTATTAPQVEEVRPEDPSLSVAQGYQWRLIRYINEDKTQFIYTHRGFGGQILFVVPEYDLIAVYSGWNVYGNSGLRYSILLEALFDSLKSNARFKLSGQG